MTYVSINSHIIRKNAKTGERKPPIRIAKTRNDKHPVYANEIEIFGESKLVYSPDKAILNCGARLVLQCEDINILS